MLKNTDINDLINDKILIQVGVDDYSVVDIHKKYVIADNYEMYALCNDDIEWTKIVEILVTDTDILIGNENYWIDDINEIKIVKVIKTIYNASHGLKN